MAHLHPTDPGVLPNRVVELAIAADMTRGQVAEATGVEPETVKAWDLGEQQIPPKQREALCKLFGVSERWLMGEL